VEGIDLHRTVSACRALLENFGGHAGAIGLTIRADRMTLFREALRGAFSEASCSGASEALRIDAELPLEAVTFDLVRALEPLAPFGPAHPEPVFLARDLSLISLRREPDRWVRFKVRDAKGWTFDVVAPNRIHIQWSDFGEETLVDLAFMPQRGMWQGEPRIFLKMKGIRRAEPRDGSDDRC